MAVRVGLAFLRLWNNDAVFAIIEDLLGWLPCIQLVATCDRPALRNRLQLQARRAYENFVQPLLLCRNAPMGAQPLDYPFGGMPLRWAFIRHCPRHPWPYCNAWTNASEESLQNFFPHHGFLTAMELLRSVPNVQGSDVTRLMLTDRGMTRMRTQRLLVRAFGFELQLMMVTTARIA